jgi:hypothetical protein
MTEHTSSSSVQVNKNYGNKEFITDINLALMLGKESPMCRWRGSVRQRMLGRREWPRFKFKKVKESELMNASIKGWTNYPQLVGDEMLH